EGGSLSVMRAGGAVLSWISSCGTTAEAMSEANPHWGQRISPKAALSANSQEWKHTWHVNLNGTAPPEHSSKRPPRAHVPASSSQAESTAAPGSAKRKSR